MSAGGGLRLAVIGHPVAHSRSPAMHLAGLRAVGLAGAYAAVDVPAEGLAGFVAGMAAAGYRGVNATIPHKRALVDLVDDLSPAAAAAGSVNTVLVEPDGELSGHSTDGEGLLWALGGPPPSTALVLGAGGAARASVAALVAAGCAVVVCGRDAAVAGRLAAELGATATAWPARETAALVVNATPIGQVGDAAALPLPAGLLAVTEVVCDLAYRGDGVETGLVRAGRAAGIRVVDGLQVLLGQGLAAFRLFTGVEPPVAAMAAAVRAG